MIIKILKQIFSPPFRVEDHPDGKLILILPNTRRIEFENREDLIEYIEKYGAQELRGGETIMKE